MPPLNQIEQAVEGIVKKHIAQSYKEYEIAKSDTAHRRRMAVTVFDLLIPQNRLKVSPVSYMKI